MTFKLATGVDLGFLLQQAPAAVDSFSPGHWSLMIDLEHRASEIVRNRDARSFVDFLCDTAFLKQPYRVDRAGVRRSLSRFPAELAASLDALQRLGTLDYRAMDSLAGLPWFGRGGGRAFIRPFLDSFLPVSLGSSIGGTWL